VLVTVLTIAIVTLGRYCLWRSERRSPKRCPIPRFVSIAAIDNWRSGVHKLTVWLHWTKLPQGSVACQVRVGVERAVTVNPRVLVIVATTTIG